LKKWIRKWLEIEFEQAQVQRDLLALMESDIDIKTALHDIRLAVLDLAEKAYPPTEIEKIKENSF